MTSIRKAAVVGAGNMGSGIAQKIATEGLPVVLLDMNEAGLDRGMTIIKTLLNQGVERKLFSPEQVQAILGRITPSTDFNLAKDCDVVVEAVFEDLKVKRDVFAKLDAICPPTTILGTNTSSFYVKDLMPGLRHPARVVGLHYFFHPAKNRLVEVIGGEGSSPEAERSAWTFNEMIGKTPIHSKDAPGFVVNRYFVPWLNEAVRLLEEKVADIPTIEAAAKEAFRIGMGPFELMNVTGVPIAYHAATTLGNTLGAFYAPAALLKKQVESKQNWDLSGTPDASKSVAVAERLLAVTFQVAGALVDEGVASIEDTDIGARVGLRWSMGPFEIMNRQGLPKARAMVQSLIATYKDLKMPQCIAKQGDAPFTFNLVRIEKKGAIATITFNRPDALNALNEEVMKQLRARFDEAEKDAAVTTIVLSGAGKAFVAGADIRYFVKKIEAKKVADIETFTKAGQDLFRDIDNSKKFVIVRLDGLSLGGGSELVLCADSVIATAKG
ncbi:MAG: 3-hydroxyacyl-CoA dehydrogenase NAD-binding domain-containing protein, partial [Planctomycetota bacterium]